jgi:hypothetical protein
MAASATAAPTPASSHWKLSIRTVTVFVLAIVLVEIGMLGPRGPAPSSGRMPE